MKRVMGPELLALQNRFECWRKQRPTRVTRIPRELWDEAVRVADIEGLHATAKALRLEYYALRKRFDEAQADGELIGSHLATVAGTAVQESLQTTFVQVQVPPLEAQRDGTMVIELTGRCGDRMRIEAQHAARVDVVGVVQAFWSRAS